MAKKKNKNGTGIAKLNNIPEILEEIIYRRYSLGHSQLTIRKYLIDTYSICVSRTYELIKQAKEEIGTLHNELNKNVLEDAIEILESMREKAIQQGDDKHALKVQQELNKLHQLHITKLEIDGKINIEQKLFTDDK